MNKELRSDPEKQLTWRETQKPSFYYYLAQVSCGRQAGLGGGPRAGGRYPPAATCAGGGAGCVAGR